MQRGVSTHNQSPSRIIGISNVSNSVPFGSHLTEEIYGSGEGKPKTILLLSTNQSSGFLFFDVSQPPTFNV